MLDDVELLRRYAQDRSEESFAELVRRHLSLVYSVALRRVGGDAHLANDVTQRVFIDLARKAAVLCRRQVLTGWLFTSTRFAASETVRRERRRQAHEQDPQTMQTLFPDSGSGAEWDRLRPVLDDLINELGEADREAVLLRFFEGRPFAEVGEKLNLSENTARMRVDRALDKLRALLARRGIKSTTAALGAALAGQASFAAPAGMAGAISGVALAGAALAGGAAGSASAFLQFMSINKITLGVVGLIAAAGVVSTTAEIRANQRLRDEIAGLNGPANELDQLRLANLQLRKREGELKAAAATARNAFDRARSAPNAVAEGNPRQVVLDRQPTPIDQVQAVYPPELKAAGISGRVIVDFIVDSNGSVHNPFAAGSTRREFEAPATQAVAQWVFRPGQRGARAVNTHMQVPILFGSPDQLSSPAENAPSNQQTVNLNPFVQPD